MADFDNKVVIVTGAGGGIGATTAIKLAENGAKLTLVDINEKGLQETEKTILSKNDDAQVLLITADVSKESDVENYVSKTKEKFGRIDGFFNNAGVEAKNIPMDSYDSDIYQRVVSINQDGVFFGMKHVLGVMKEQGSGTIVNTASIAGIRAVPLATPYMASKHAVIGMTKEAALEYGQYGLSINAIAPGVIFTPMIEAGFKDAAGEHWEQAVEAFVSVNPKKRMGTTEEVAELAMFMLSGKANYMNGIVIPIDGGQSNVY